MLILFLKFLCTHGIANFVKVNRMHEVKMIIDVNLEKIELKNIPFANYV